MKLEKRCLVAGFGLVLGVEALPHRIVGFENQSGLEGSSGNLGQWCL